MNILMAVAGILSIYLGYRLFCDSAYQRSRVRHLVSGALLAVFGLGILIADLHDLRAARHDPQAARYKRKSTKEGSFERPAVHRRASASEWQV